MQYCKILMVFILFFACCANAAGEQQSQRELRFDEIYSGSGPQGPQFSPLARSFIGKRVRVSGYIAPPFRAEAEFLILTRSPIHVCPYCNADNNWPIDIIVVTSRDAPPQAVNASMRTINGLLELGPKLDPITGMVSQLRLIDAVVEAAAR